METLKSSKEASSYIFSKNILGIVYTKSCLPGIWFPFYQIPWNQKKSGGRIINDIKWEDHFGFLILTNFKH